MRKFILGFALLVAACATPLEQCIANSSRDLRVLNGLVAQTRGNIERGFAIRSEEYFETEEQVCGAIDGEAVYCNVPVAQSRNVPVAINLDAEQAKLNSLLNKQAELSQRANAVAAECRIRHPEV